jgi:Fe-S cluster assembly protein SufD
MNPQTEQRRWFNDTVADNAAHLSGVGLRWLDVTRAEARQAVNELALPDRRQEAWRYSSLDRLYQQRFRHGGKHLPQDADIERWVYSTGDSHRLVIVNGHFVANLSTRHALPDGVTISSLKQQLDYDPDQVAQWLAGSAWQKPDVFSEMNRALINDGVIIRVGENVALDRPVEIVYLNTSADQDVLAQPYSLLMLEAGAQASVVERYTGDAEASYFFNGITAVSLGANARLQHYRLQQEGALAHHLSRVALRQASASEYHGVNIASGGAWSRTDIQARFEGPHAVCNLDGLYTVGEKQYTDFHLDVIHGLPHCSSREDFKGIVYGKGRAVFDGRILVEKDAQKTDARLSNRNLLLTPFAEVDTKPQLEIHADDVKCSHGTTVGRLDPNQLFYLRSRGIEEHEARKMICLGFAEQVLAQVEDEAVHDYIQHQIGDLFSREAVQP